MSEVVVKMAEMEGRGRALIAAKAVKGGEIVLKDSPILIYSALPLKQPPPPPESEQQLTSSNYYYCSNCFKSISAAKYSMISCPSCYALFFCSPNCRSIGLSSSHSRWVCQALSRLRDCPSNWLSLLHQERQVQAQFLVAAYNLAVVSPSDFGTLLSLQGKQQQHQQDDDDDALFLHSLISSLCPPPPLQKQHAFSLELTAALLAKDKLNAFGLMEPFSEEENGERSVRAYGIYPKASFFNHDCLPNACRFEYLDNDSATTVTQLNNTNNTDMIVRAIHDVPQGREICLSYFPVNLNYSQRQRRLREDYGFTCECDRCKVEANWSQEEEEDNENEEAMDEDMEEEEDEYERMADSEAEDGGGVKRDNDDDFPHAYFFLRYMCNRKNCWGTLAPLPSSDSTPSSSIVECNVCGNLNKDEDEALD